MGGPDVSGGEGLVEVEVGDLVQVGRLVEVEVGGWKDLVMKQLVLHPGDT